MSRRPYLCTPRGIKMRVGGGGMVYDLIAQYIPLNFNHAKIWFSGRRFRQNDPKTADRSQGTVCPRRLGQFYIVSYNIKRVKTSWTYSNQCILDIYILMRGSKYPDKKIKIRKLSILLIESRVVHPVLLERSNSGFF